MPLLNWVLVFALLTAVAAAGVGGVLVSYDRTVNTPTTQVQRDADCATYLAELNREERAHGQPIYSFYRCPNGGTASGR